LLGFDTSDVEGAVEDPVGTATKVAEKYTDDLPAPFSKDAVKLASAGWSALNRSKDNGGNSPYAVPRGTTPSSLTEREQTAMDFYTSRGYTLDQAAGIVGNLRAESNLNPSAVNPNDAGPGNDSVGIAQWNRDRLSNLQDYARQRGTDYRDFNTQLEFVDYELRTSESRVRSELTQESSARDSAIAFARYERYRGYPRSDTAPINNNTAKRIDYANEIANTYRNTTTEPGI